MIANMKRVGGVLLVACSIFFGSLVSSPNSAAANSIVTQGSGSGADAAWADSTDSSFFYVELRFFGSSQVFVEYTVYDNTTGNFSFGYGYIPTSDVSGSITSGFKLNTDTSRFTNGSSFGPAEGPIQVDWTRTKGKFLQKRTGTTVTNTGAVTTIETGQSYVYGATATGTLFNAYSIGAPGNIMQQVDIEGFTDTTITVQKN